MPDREIKEYSVLLSYIDGKYVVCCEKNSGLFYGCSECDRCPDKKKCDCMNNMKDFI